MTFELHPNLASKIFIYDLPLCRVLMEDEKHYPWFFLIPRKPNVSLTIDLALCDQLQLVQELDLIQKIMGEEFKPAHINVAAIGNKTPQLHIHVIGRYVHDPAWPNTVWDHPIRSKYDPKIKDGIVQNIQCKLANK
jgi:diadenosine tetraphosphate (Ap4A) HIT family hydrolase